jgi:hypothetical protein
MFFNKMSALYETWNFITAFTTAPYISLSWATSSHVKHFQKLFPISIIWSSHINISFPNNLSPSDFSIKALYGPLHSSNNTTCQDNQNPLDFIIRIVSVSSADHEALHYSFCSNYLSFSTQVQIPFSPQYFQTHTICIPTTKWKKCYNLVYFNLQI